MEKEDLKKREMLDSVYFNNKSYGKENYLRHILKTMSIVDRKYFVLKKNKAHPYEDLPYLIGFNQTISQPSTVGRMLLLSNIKRGMNILEVGSGSGWNACLLGYLTYPGKVISAERILKLSRFAKNNLFDFKKETKISKLNVKFLEGSIFSHKDLMKEKFDLIIVTAAADNKLKEKLKNFNFDRLITPTKEGFLEVWRKKENKLKLEYREEGYSFVPLLR